MPQGHPMKHAKVHFRGCAHIEELREETDALEKRLSDLDSRIAAL